MNRSKWLNRGTALGLLLGVAIGAGAVLAWFELRDRNERKAAEAESPQAESPTPPADEILKPMKEKAQFECKVISDAIEAYMANPANPAWDRTDNERLPTSLNDLVHVPFGGTSFLRRGAAALTDPWGKPYLMERLRRADGSEYALVKTTAPDGTPISQFGIGPNAQPRP